MCSSAIVCTHQWAGNCINKWKGQGRQTNLIQVLTGRMVLGKFSGNLRILSLELMHQNTRNTEKVPFSPLQRRSKAYLSSWGCLRANQMNSMRGAQEEGGDKWGRLVCFTWRKGHWMSTTPSLISALTPTAVPQTVSATRALHKHSTAALGISNIVKGGNSYTSAPPPLPPPPQLWQHPSDNHLQARIFMHTVPKLCQARQGCLK